VEADVEQLTRLREAIVAAERTGDAAFFAAALDDDAVIMPPDAPAREGKAACLAFIREVLQSLLSQFERDLVCESAEVVIEGTLAFDRGSFFQTLRERGGSGLVVRERGHYVWLYVRRGTQWKLARVIWNGGEEVDDLSLDLDDAGEGSIQ
jgi:ketosteroid isomerase-like protein